MKRGAAAYACRPGTGCSVSPQFVLSLSYARDLINCALLTPLISLCPLVSLPWLYMSSALRSKPPSLYQAPDIAWNSGITA